MTRDEVRAVLRGVGACGESDGNMACLLPPEHGGLHGYELERRRPRLVECFCSPPSITDVRGGRWVRTVTHSLLCPVTAEQGTTEEEFDEGAHYPD